MFSFGSGVLLGTRTDVANATPINFGLVQEVQLDLSYTSKELYGQFQWPVAIARGQGKITGKAKMARISGIAFNNLFFGQTLATGQLGATGLPLTKVASAPNAGQYSVAAGVYTFGSGDAGKAVLISYTFTLAGSGQQVTLPNPLLGTTPTFQAQLFTTFQGQPLNVKLFNCVSSKLGFHTKLEDFVVPELDFAIAANAAGNVLQWSFAEAS